MCWSIFAILLALSPAAAQQLDGIREKRAPGRIVMTSRGQALYEKGDPNSQSQDASNGASGATDASGSSGSGSAQSNTGSHAVASPKEFVQLVNGSTPTGYMQLGTPPKYLLVIFDTGSDKLVAKTWDTVSNELASIDQGISGMVNPSDKMYNHNTSSTYATRFMTDPKTNKTVPAKNEIAYGSGMAITDEGNDTVKMGPFMLKNFSLSEITADSLQLLHTSKGISGVLGLQHMKNRSLGRSLFSRFRDEGLLTAFGYCRGTGDNGTFIWGDQSTEGHELPVIGDMHWAVALGSIKMNGTGAKEKPPAKVVDDGKTTIVKVKALDGSDPGDDVHAPSTEDVAMGDSQIPPATGESPPALSANATKPVPCSDNKCTGIFDTGSNIIAGPTEVMKALTEQANVATDCSNYKTLPIISLNFGGEEVTVHPEGYVMKVPMPKWAAGMGGGGPGSDGDGDGDSSGGQPGGGQLQSGDGDGDAAGGAGSSGGMGGGMGAGLAQKSGTKTRARLGWKAVFEHLKNHRGIDLTTAMNGQHTKFDAPNATQPDFLCMPALVPIDKHTKFGPLYIVGTPLLQTHYARWSYAADPATGDKSVPKIHIKKLTESETCKNKALSGDASASLEAIAPVSSPLMRRDRIQTLTGDRPSKGPFIRNIEDISFPHWARHIETL